ncbi:MAG: glycosyl hydrolase family 28-related protein [Acidobacteriota bacterium]
MSTVDTILGAPPPAARTGDLALNTATQLGATLVIAKGCITPGDGGGGIFYWDPSSLSDDGGTTILPTGGGGVWRRVYTGPLSVQWFGTVGDGSRPDQDAIRNAIDACAPDGGVVLFPPGRYRTTATVFVRGSNVTLQGSGRATVLAPAGDFDTVVIKSPTSDYLYGNRILDLLFDESGKTGGRMIYGERAAQFTAQRVSGESGFNGMELNQFNIVCLYELHLVYYRGGAGSAYLRLTSGSVPTNRADVAWVRDSILSTDDDHPSPGMKGIDIDGFVHTVNLTKVGIGNSGAEALLVRNSVGGIDVPTFITAYDLEIEFPALECIRLDAGVKCSFTSSVVHGSKWRDNVYIGAACRGVDFTGGCSTGARQSGIAIAGKDIAVCSMHFSENNQMGADAPYPGILVGGSSRGVVITGCRSGETKPGGSQRYGCQVDTEADDFCITGNNFVNNREKGGTSGVLSAAGSGTATKVISRNAFNPRPRTKSS